LTTNDEILFYRKFESSLNPRCQSGLSNRRRSWSFTRRRQNSSSWWTTRWRNRQADPSR